MYIGELCTSGLGQTMRIRAFRSGTHTVMPAEGGEVVSVNDLPAAWPWEAVMTTGVDLLIELGEPCRVDSLRLCLKDKGSVSAVEVFAEHGPIGERLASLDSSCGRELPSRIVLTVDTWTDRLLIRLAGNMRGITLEQLQLFGCSMSKDEPVIYPIPSAARIFPGTIPVSALLCPVRSSGGDADIAFCEEYLKRHFSLPERTDGRYRLVMHKDNSLSDNGFVLDVQADGIELRARDRNGLLYAACVLIQLSGQGALPLCHIEDAPRFPMRGVHLGLPPREEIPFFKRLISELLVPLRYNTLFLQFTAGMHFRSHPEINEGWINACEKSAAGEWPTLHHSDMIAGGGVLEQDEVRELVCYAQAHGLEVIPEIQSLGHVQYMTISHPELAERAEAPVSAAQTDERLADRPPDDFYPHSYCPSNEASYQLLFELMDEILSVVRPKRFVHMGHDEVYQIGLCPVCRNVPPDRLLERHVRRVHDYLARRGLRMMMWSDMVQPYSDYPTANALSAIPRDIVLLDFIWYFHPDQDIEQPLLQQGFDVVIGNLYSSHYPRFTERTWTSALLGGEVSTWCRPDQATLSREGKLFDFAYTAQMLWGDGYEALCRPFYTRLIAEWIPYWRQNLSGRRSPLCVPDAVWTPVVFRSDSALPGASPYAALSFTSGASVYHTGQQKQALCWLRSGASVQARVDAAPDSIVLTHACQNALLKEPYRPAPEIGFYQIVFSDGTSEMLAIRYGENIGCALVPYAAPQTHAYFRHTGYQAVFGCDAAFTAKTAEGRPVTLYGIEWNNPEKKHIEHITCTLFPDCGTDLLLGTGAGICV